MMTDLNLWEGARRFQSGPAPRHAVLLLHGLGSNADDLIELAPALAMHLPDAVFVSPNAPFACDMAPAGRQWFSLLDWSPASLWRGVCEAAPFVERMIREVREEFALPMAAVALLGFSQGAMLSLHVAPRLSETLAGVVGLSGALVGGEHLPEEVVSRPPVLLVHGQMDPVVPYAAMPAAAGVLRGCGFEVASETRPFLGHGVDEVGLATAGAFLARFLE